MNYRPEIDGLRALAVIPVILFHAKIAGFYGGFLGVDVFFTISGYLISLNILQQGADFRLLRFYEKRARRILPALLVVLLATLPAAYWLLPPAPLLDFSKSIIATLFFVANIYFWQREDYFAEPAELTPLLHTWSLAVEEQFYLLFPFTLIVLRRRPRVLLALIFGAGLISLVWALVKHASAPSDVFYMAQFRAWQLLAGAAVAWLEIHGGRRQHWAGVVIGIVLIFAAFAISDRTTPAVLGSFVATVGTTLVIYYGGDNLPSRLIRAPPLRWIGLISYSLYLWHQPLFGFARFYFLNALTLWSYALLMMVSVAMAWLSYIYIEGPARLTITRTRFTTSVAAVTGLLIVVGISAIAAAGFPFRYSAEQLAILTANPVRGIAFRDGRSCRREIADACTIGDASRSPTFAILGDSHAEALTNALSEKLDARSLSAIVLTVPACPLLLDGVEIGAPTRCAAYTHAVLVEIERRGIRNVIINERSAAYFRGAFDNGEGGVENEHITMFATAKAYSSDAERLNNLYTSQANFIRVLLDRGLTIYYVFPIPEAGWHVPRTLVRAITSGNLPLTTDEVKYRERNGETLRLAEAFKANDRFLPISTANLFCSQTRCKTHIGTQILYTDTDHLSEAGAKIVANAISQHFR